MSNFRFPDFYSLTVRLSLALSLIVVMVVSLVLAVLSLELSAERDTLLDRSLEWQAKDVAVHLSLDQETGRVSLDLPQELVDAYNRTDGQYLYLVTDSDHAPIFHSRHGLTLRGHSNDSGQISFFQYQDLQLNQTFYGASLQFWIGEKSYFVNVAQGPIHSDVLADTLIEEFLENEWWAVLLFMVAIVGTVIFTVRYSLRPVEQAANRALHLGPSSLDMRLDEKSLPSEVRPFVKTINSALDRIEDGYRREREFTANAAHQLRTPLTILRANLETGQFERSQALEEVQSLERLVLQFLHLAQADNFVMTENQTADLREVAEETLSALAPYALSRGQHVELDAGPLPVFVKGSASFISIALRNLVENALTYSSAGKTVVVRLKEDGSIRVEDEGKGIPKDQQSKVFARFWRADRTEEDGAGLGLSIVSQIVEGHGGTVELAENSGSGCIFTLTFPLA